MSRSQKKIDKLEVRLSPEAKASFAARCQSEGRPASEVVRALIEARLNMHRSLNDLPQLARVLSVTGGVVAAGLAVLSLAGAVSAELRDFRLGVVVFLTLQGAQYAVVAAAFLKANWRLLAGTLAAQFLVQTVFTAEVNPPLPVPNAMVGLLVGVFPTLVLVILGTLAWRSARRAGKFASI